MRIGEFEIESLIGEGGFGIVYLAYDTLLDRHVALKEYMPGALATRGAQYEVTVRSERHAETFRAGLKSFINEARLLAQFDHHSLIKVYRFWEANGTAYMVMPYYEGVTLRDALRAMGAPPDEAWLRALLGPLVDALAVMHRAQCFHRDIAPDNILLLKESGRPLLLDFGAARRVIGDMTQALTVILKPGYAPVEQYAEIGALKQGPWTDLYALAAVAYFAIARKTPPPSVGRMITDTYEPLATIAAGRYSHRFLQAIDRSLAVQPEARPQSVQAFAEELRLSSPREGAQDDTVTTPVPPASPITSNRISGGRKTPATSDTSRTQPGKWTLQPGAAARDADGSRRASLRGAVIATSAVAVIVLAGVAAWFALRPSGTPPASSSMEPASAGAFANVPAYRRSPASDATESQTASIDTSQSASEATAASGGQERGTTLPPAAPVVEAKTTKQTPPPPPYKPADELDRIVVLSDPSIKVTVVSRNKTARIDRDYLQFKVSSVSAGYVYVFMVDPAGQYLMLFPNGIDSNNHIAGGQILSLPRANWPMKASAPAGPNRFLVMVSPAPRDFSDAGLENASIFAEFPENAQRSAAVRRTTNYSPFVGKPSCAKGAANCTDAYGATVFTIDVVKSPA
jgi:serine/threonine protein kinase